MAMALFEAMETARCEAMGARAMPGTAGNIDARIADEARRMGYAEITDAARAPLAQAAGYLVRHLATGRTAAGGRARTSWTSGAASSRARPAARSPGLDDVLDDQQAFARFARRVIADLGYGDELGEDPDAGDDAEEEEADEEAAPQPQEQAGDAEDQSEQESEQDESASDQRTDPQDMQAAMDMADDDRTSPRSSTSRRARRPSAGRRRRTRRPTRATRSTPPASTRRSPPRTSPTRSSSSGCAPISTSSSSR